MEIATGIFFLMVPLKQIQASWNASLTGGNDIWNRDWKVVGNHGQVSQVNMLAKSCQTPYSWTSASTWSDWSFESLQFSLRPKKPNVDVLQGRQGVGAHQIVGPSPLKLWLTWPILDELGGGFSRKSAGKGAGSHVWNLQKQRAIWILDVQFFQESLDFGWTQNSFKFLRPSSCRSHAIHPPFVENLRSAAGLERLAAVLPQKTKFPKVGKPPDTGRDKPEESKHSIIFSFVTCLLQILEWIFQYLYCIVTESLVES